MPNEDQVTEKYSHYMHIFSTDRSLEEIQNAVNSIFARAYKDELRSSEEYNTPQEWKCINIQDEKIRARRGAKKFKRKVFKRDVLGFFGLGFVIKSLDELAESLLEVGIVENMQEGKVLVPYLSGKEVKYSEHTIGDGIKFNEVVNKEGEKKYKVEFCVITDKQKNNKN